MNLLKHFICYVFLFLSGFPLSAQTNGKTDVIFKLNGDELKGEVKAMEENAVKFVYTGEALEYTIKKDEIAKIVFRSGRVEVINSSSPANNNRSEFPNANQPAANHKNRVAILPFRVLMDGKASGEDMQIKIQNECSALLNQHLGSLVLNDNQLTNATLIKAGINAQNMMGYTMQEICDLLGVEYVISGIVTIDRTDQTTYSSNTQNSAYKKTDDAQKSKSSTYGSSYTTNTQNYATSLLLSIYNDKNENVFNQERKAFWHMQDAYKATLEYLIKRSPLYKK